MHTLIHLFSWQPPLSYGRNNTFGGYNIEPCCFVGLRYILLFCFLLSFSGCGSLTGIPGHGGGKRFAVEQELVAASTRATVKQIDLSSLKGKKVNLFVNAIGDTGSGNLIGGRLSFVSQIRGDYIQSPAVTESSVYPRYSSTTTSSSTTGTDSNSSDETIQNSLISTSSNFNSSSSHTSGTTTTSTLLNSPTSKTTKQRGSGGEMQLGVEYNGLGSYRNSDEISSNDLQYLSGLLQTYLFLQGVHIVPPSEAEVDVYVTVDVFGTVRTRVDWFIANNEILRAKTALEIMAVDHQSGELIMSPQASVTEAEYNEQYIVWAGPVIIKKFLKPSDPLLCDFTELTSPESLSDLKEQDGAIEYPFRHQIEKWGEKNEQVKEKVE